MELKNPNTGKKEPENLMRPAGLDDLQILLLKSYINQYEEGSLLFDELRDKILGILGVKLDPSKTFRIY